MPQVVPPKVLVSEARHHLVPMGGIAQDRRGNPAAAGAGEQSAVSLAHDGQAGGDQLARFLNDRHLAGSLALCRLVDQSTGARCGLTPDGPDPPAPVNVGFTDAGHLTDSVPPRTPRRLFVLGRNARLWGGPTGQGEMPPKEEMTG